MTWYKFKPGTPSVSAVSFTVRFKKIKDPNDYDTYFLQLENGRFFADKYGVNRGFGWGPRSWVDAWTELDHTEFNSELDELLK